MWWWATPVANANPRNSPAFGPCRPRATWAQASSTSAAVSVEPLSTSGTTLHRQNNTENPSAPAATVAATPSSVTSSVARCSSPRVAAPSVADSALTFHATVPKGSASTSARASRPNSG